MSEKQQAQIGRVSLAVELDGECFFVNLPQDRLRMLVHMSQGLFDNGVFNVVPAPEGFHFADLSEHQTPSNP